MARGPGTWRSRRDPTWWSCRPQGLEVLGRGRQRPYLPLKTRPEVFVFQTQPLEVAVEVVGLICVVLYASSTAVDTDFTGKLVDVYPPSEDVATGFEMNPPHASASTPTPGIRWDNTGGTVPADNSIHHEPGYPSHVVLPLVAVTPE